MKKILEVLQYGDNDIRFNTDLDVEKDPLLVGNVIFDATFAMTTILWGGNECSVLAMIRALSIADLALCVNRKAMLDYLDDASRECAKALEGAKQAMMKNGIEVKTFAPWVKPGRAN